MESVRHNTHTHARERETGACTDPLQGAAQVCRLCLRTLSGQPHLQAVRLVLPQRGAVFPSQHRTLVQGRSQALRLGLCLLQLAHQLRRILVRLRRQLVHGLLRLAPQRRQLAFERLAGLATLRQRLLKRDLRDFCTRRLCRRRFKVWHPHLALHDPLHGHLHAHLDCKRVSKRLRPRSRLRSRHTLF